MIESQADYNNFLQETNNHDIILYVIASDNNIHSAVSKPAAVLIKDLETDKTYILSINHPDSIYFVDINRVISDIQRSQKMWCFDKKSTILLLPIKNLLDIDLYTHLKEGWIVDLSSHETTAHKLIKRNYQKERNINLSVPLLKHKELFENACDEVRIKTQLSDFNKGYIKENNIVIETLSELEMNGIHVNPVCFKSHFDACVHDNNLVYSQYNIYTSTGRPSNRFDGVNYAALNKSDGTRKCFTSRFGDDGKMVLIDYSAFHPRIISTLIDFNLPLETDIYKYLGEMYFNRHITEYDMDEIKSITMRQLYGGVETKYEHIKFFKYLKQFIEKYWERFQKNSFIETPYFGRRISDKHLLDPNPNKLFNYILQATETEIAVTSLMLVNHYLKTKKTKAVLYTYDSILFDFCKLDGDDTLKEIIKIMKMKDRFPIKVYEGDSYDSVVQINL